MISCLFSGGKIISSGSFISFSFSLFFDSPGEVILSAILFPIKSPVASAFFLTILSPAVLAKLIPSFFVVPIIFYHAYHQTSLQLLFLFLLQYLLIYLSPNFLAKDRKPYPFTYLL